MTNEKRTERVTAMMARGEIKAIDAWRAKQDDLPNRSEAIRRLVTLALSEAAKQSG